VERRAGGLFQVPPIVATLILMVSGRGIAQLITGGQIITFENRAFEFLGRGTLFVCRSPSRSSAWCLGCWCC